MLFNYLFTEMSKYSNQTNQIQYCVYCIEFCLKNKRADNDGNVFFSMKKKKKIKEEVDKDKVKPI